MAALLQLSNNNSDENDDDNSEDDLFPFIFLSDDDTYDDKVDGDNDNCNAIAVIEWWR